MKKKLALKRITIRYLATTVLARVGGGVITDTWTNNTEVEACNPGPGGTGTCSTTCLTCPVTCWTDPPPR